MRLLTLAILGCLLAAVYWVGATEYTDRIETDIRDRSSVALAKYQPDVNISVDGRDVTIKGTVASEEVKEEVSSIADSVWGCLLYTSPSPRDQRGTRMPSSA